MVKTTSGFTLVELLIVIVVLAVLAAITAVAYNGLQVRAQNAKITTDIATLQKAIISAREAKTNFLLGITGSGSGGVGGQAAGCFKYGAQADYSDPTKVPDCWSDWNKLTKAVSDASGINITTMKDPWNQPYMVVGLENKGDCRQDEVFAVKPPVNGWGTTRLGAVKLPLTPYSGCA